MENSEENLFKEKIQAILEDLNELERKFLSRVIEAEREKLHMSKPRGINDDIVNALEEIFK